MGKEKEAEGASDSSGLLSIVTPLLHVFTKLDTESCDHVELEQLVSCLSSDSSVAYGVLGIEGRRALVDALRIYAPPLKSIVTEVSRPLSRQQFMTILDRIMPKLLEYRKVFDAEAARLKKERTDEGRRAKKVSLSKSRLPLIEERLQKRSSEAYQKYKQIFDRMDHEKDVVMRIRAFKDKGKFSPLKPKTQMRHAAVALECFLPHKLVVSDYDNPYL